MKIYSICFWKNNYNSRIISFPILFLTIAVYPNRVLSQTTQGNQSDQSGFFLFDFRALTNIDRIIPIRKPIPKPTATIEPPKPPFRPVPLPTIGPIEPPIGIPKPIPTPVEPPIGIPKPIPTPVEPPIGIPKPIPTPVEPPIRIPKPIPTPVEPPIGIPKPIPTPVEPPIGIPKPIPTPVEPPIGIPKPIPTPVEPPIGIPKPIPTPVEPPIGIPKPIPTPVEPPIGIPKPIPTPIEPPIGIPVFPKPPFPPPTPPKSPFPPPTPPTPPTPPFLPPDGIILFNISIGNDISLVGQNIEDLKANLESLVPSENQVNLNALAPTKASAQKLQNSMLGLLKKLNEIPNDNAEVVIAKQNILNELSTSVVDLEQTNDLIKAINQAVAQSE